MNYNPEDTQADENLHQEMLDEITRLNKALEYACKQLSRCGEYGSMTPREVSDSILQEVDPIIIG
jgi:hypothetical protein